MPEEVCSSQTSLDYWRPDLQQQAPDPRPQEGQLILDRLAWSLPSLPKGSVCPEEDVSAVLQELEKQWKKRQLPNMLPVLEFIMWSLIQDQAQQKLQSAFRSAVEEPQSLDESKCIIRDLALQLDRVSQHKSRAVLLSVTEDSCSLQECQHFILQWAEELRNLPQRQQISEGECSSQTSLDYRRPDLQHEAPDNCSPAQEQKLKEAQLILDQWAWSLQSLPKGSVCPGEDVSAVLQELEKQWKKGRLSNMLPVLEFIMWSLIQDQSQQGSVPQLWLRSKQRFKNGAAFQHIPRSVWNWIQKAAADIRLDPNTANPDLKVSADGKTVKMDSIIESVHNPREGYHRSPHKYDGWWCVQGTEGFTSGRHYWEVGVQGKTEWRIGVVKESAERRGFMELNTHTGYWTLCLQLGVLMAVTTPVCKLSQSIPSRVGVYLDIEEGQLSFYDVERRCHIYTFNNNFTEKVYPLFGTVETDKEIIIKDFKNA
ncbi:E3 ubiquitin-protein ligase TRIM39-like [Megalops cyprinoides]|uniref:E3 ubiquitin-protein ligase TRIM39-like n=1 Tax=Megalops cyprinoides TaxID=118141 RepID=UPI001863FF7D|nr:E3 ubiquitin-protein ligase TRIM39-like [Megalops cyprinoides]